MALKGTSANMMGQEVHAPGAPVTQNDGWTSALLVCLVVIATLYGLSIYHGPTSEIGSHEVRVLETARVMAATGDWIVPRFAGEARLTKPPLPYWMALASYELFGEATIWAARRTLLLLAAILLLSTYAMARRVVDRKGAAIAVLVLASSYLFLVEYRKLTPDPVLTSCIAAAVASLAWSRAGTKNSGSLLVLGDGCVGLSLLAKGPIAIPFIVIGVYALSRPGDRWPCRAGWHALLCLFALAPVAAWALAVYLREPAAFEVWRSEVLGRLPGQKPTDSGRGPSVYLGATLQFLLPWTPVLLGALFFRSRADTRVRVGFLVGLAMLVALSSRKLAYMLPLLPLAAVAVASYLVAYAPTTLRRRFEGHSTVVAGQILLISVASLIPVGYAARSYLELSGLSIPPAALLLLALIGLLWAMLARRSPLVPAALMALFGMILWTQVLRPHEPHSLTRYNMGARIKLLNPEEGQLFQLGEQDARLNFHAARVPTRIASFEDLPADLPEKALVIAPESKLPEMLPRGLAVIGQEVVSEGKDPLVLLSPRPIR
ncbi:MAG TPA: glycosyltransferase family 39 protein [Planctomycetota bacterium]|jgi:4-amino-4-deoxy-L-arabinose transferase-like glycosyltransferase|nr:glycosyltransferase family 39 protein [Planctomycetota bacterium]